MPVAETTKPRSLGLRNRQRGFLFVEVLCPIPLKPTVVPRATGQSAVIVKTTWRRPPSTLPTNKTVHLICGAMIEVPPPAAKSAR